MEQTNAENESKTNGEIQPTTNAEELRDNAPSAKTQDAEGASFKRYFSARRIAFIATFTALSFALRFFQFSILPAVPFLKFDFSDALALICAYAVGPVAGLITGILKEVIYGIFFSSSAFVGELANIIILIPFILIPSIIYKNHKGLKSVIIWLTVACVVRTIWSFPVNLLLNFPAFMGFNWDLGMAMFLKVWYWTVLFNFIKNVILAVVVALLYKSVSRLIRIINSKFDKKNVKPV